MAHHTDPLPRTDQDFGSAMVALIGPRWDRLWDELDRLRQGDDADAIHDIRVASRRLRAAMDVAAPCFPAEWFGPLHRAARDVTRALGGVRDQDVILQALTAERRRADPADRPALDALIAHVERERKLARRAMREFLAVLESSGTREQTRRRFAGAAETDR